jgi:hypothetical protein
MDNTLVTRKLARQIWVPLIWLGGVVLVLSGRRDNFDALGRQYGANWPGDLSGAVIQLAIESVIPYAILRPHSYNHSWRRCLAALAVLLPWTLIDMFLIMHTGRKSSPSSCSSLDARRPPVAPSATRLRSPHHS